MIYFLTKFMMLRVTCFLLATLVSTCNNASPIINFDVNTPIKTQKQGMMFANLLWSTNKIIQDIELALYLKHLGKTLVSYSSEPKAHFNFYLLDDNSINAFAGPYGYIGINAGLILASDYEDELAAVLAHEIAHVSKRHLSRYEQKIKNNDYLLIAAILTSLVSKNSDVREALSSSAFATNLQRSINFTRTHEKEADRIGIDTLIKSGFNPKGMTRFFTKLKDKEGAIEYLRTHPLSINRISESLTRIPAHQTYDYKSSFLYQIMRARLYYYSLKRVYAEDKASKLYMEAYDGLMREQAQNATSYIKQLLKINQDPASYVLAARVATLAQDYDQAIHYLKYNLKQTPSDEVSTYYLAKTYEKKAMRARAISILKAFTRSYNASYQTYELLAQLYLANKEIDRWHIMMAYALTQKSRLKSALKHLERAKLLIKNTNLLDVTSENIKQVKQAIDLLQ